jgi:hypothetical protein
MRVKVTTSRAASESLRDLISRAVGGHAPAVTVQRRQIAYWQERGWTRQHNIYTGNYQTVYAAFHGHISEHPGGHIDFLLYNPSEEIRRHSHWACFQDRGNDWYLVHMFKQPKDVSSGILTIERLITEAYKY